MAMKRALLIFSFTSFLWMHSNAENADEAPQAKFQLPDTLTPEAYSIIINVSLEENEPKFWGTVDITIKCLKPTKTIIMHSKELTIAQDRVTVKEGETALKIVSQEMDDANDLYTITVEQDVAAEASFIVHIPFTAPLNIGLTGLYRSSYIDMQSGETRWMAASQAEPIYARKIYPCFDEMQFKSKFSITIGHATNLKSISNMPLKESQPSNEKPDWVMDVFDESVPLSTYIVAFIVTDFESIEVQEPKLNIPVRVWARKDVMTQTKYAQENVVNCLGYFADYFQAPYEIKKLDLVAVPDFQLSGMENHGVITFKENDMLIDDVASFVSDQVNTGMTTCHEVSHLWMGNLATFKPWQSMWLKEGFANFFEKYALSTFKKEWDLMNTEFTFTFIEALAADGLKESRKLAYEIQNIMDPVHLFDTITYQKGSMLIRMLFLVLGEEPFKKAVSEFLKQFTYKVATMDDVWKCFTDAVKDAKILPAEADVKAIMDTWTNQRGYPLLKLTRDVAAKKIKIEQESFIFNVEGEPPADSPCWWVPLSYTTSKEPNFDDIAPKQWIPCQPLEFDLELAEQDWILINLKLTSLCRVLYDEATWKLISATLLNEKEFTKIDVLSRVHLISDIEGLTWIGKMEYEAAFETLAFLKFETEYSVWIKALSLLGSLRFMLSNTEIIDQYQNWVKTLVEPTYLKLGKLNEFNLDDPLQVRFKAEFISFACSFGAKDCSTEAIDLFNKWMGESEPDVNNPISPPARGNVYCWGVVSGGQAAFNFIFERYQKTTIATEKSIMLDALACVQDKNIINNLLTMSLDPTIIRQQDSVRIYVSLISNDLATDETINFFLTRFDEIYKFLNGNPVALGSYLINMYSRIMTEDQFKKVQEFVETVKDRLQVAEIRLKEAVDKARDNILWHQRSYEKLKTVLGSIDTNAA